MVKIIGNTTATPNPRPDWNQTDETKADFIKNKPDIDILSQGRSAKYNFTTPGWKRILNIIRATNGAIDIGLASGWQYYMTQTLAFDITGFVKYPNDVSNSIPTIIKRYENIFGNDDATTAHSFKVSKIRIGYPAEDTDFPETDGAANYKANPVNCYVDIYIDFNNEDHDYIAFNMNYAGFADSHNCVAITEETNATDIGIYGETLQYYEVDVDSMPYFMQNTEMTNYVSKDNVYSGPSSRPGYGIRMHSTGFLCTEAAKEEHIDAKSSEYRVITPKHLDYAVKSVGDGYYVKIDDVDNSLDQNSINPVQNKVIVEALENTIRYEVADETWNSIIYSGKPYKIGTFEDGLIIGQDGNGDWYFEAYSNNSAYGSKCHITHNHIKIGDAGDSIFFEIHFNGSEGIFTISGSDEAKQAFKEWLGI